MLIKKINPAVVNAYSDTRNIFLKEAQKMQDKIEAGTATEEDRIYLARVQHLISSSLVNEITYINKNVWLRKRFWKKALQHTS